MSATNKETGNGVAIKKLSKIEDVVSISFSPHFFKFHQNLSEFSLIKCRKLN